MCDEVKFISNISESSLEKLNDIQRQLHCSAYNCLVAMFIRTQKEPRLYSAYLFKDDSTKNEFVFEPLIDKKKEYKFAIEVENFQERKTKFISLRNEFKENSTSSHNMSYLSSMATNTMAIDSSNNQISYLNTQHLYESSLSEELSVFDFTGTSKGASYGAPSSQQQSMNLKRYLNAQDEQSSSEAQESLVEVELDELSQHESMLAFIKLLQSLVVNNITPIYEKGILPKEMPPWMEFLHKKVADVYTNENVKLFIIKALISTQSIFKSYAKFWYAPLIGFLVNSSFSREDTMDYFSLDLMVLLLSWHSVVLPSANDKKLINRLFENLMRRCYHDNRAILKNNLELLKTMTECWREFIDVPVGIIYDFLKSNDSKKLTTGIQLLGVVLANNIETYDYPVDVSSLDLYKMLIKAMKDSSKLIHAPSAEVVGMLLRRLYTKNDSLELITSVEDYLSQILKDLDIALFITCIHRIQLNYPQLTQHFMSMLLYNLTKLYGEFKLMCAESILASISTVDTLILRNNAFTDMITHRDSSLQLVCLKMINGLLSKLNEEELVRLLPIVCGFIDHGHVG